MRKVVIIGAGLALGAVVLGFATLSKPTGKAQRPTLRVVRLAPLAVRGRHFQSRERVRLAAGSTVVRTKASGGGVFVVTIRGATRCDAVRVLARGSAGSYAVVKVLPPPACAAVRSAG